MHYAGRAIARELVERVRSNVTIDWALRENIRAHLRRLVKRVLRKHGYPPDKQEKATRTVLEQAEVLSADRIPGRRSIATSFITPPLRGSRQAESEPVGSNPSCKAP